MQVLPPYYRWYHGKFVHLFSFFLQTWQFSEFQGEYAEVFPVSAGGLPAAAGVRQLPGE